MSTDLARLDATAQAELVRKGEVTPRELVDAAIARIEKINPQLNAVITPLFEKARTQARSAAIPPITTFAISRAIGVGNSAAAIIAVPATSG